MTVASLRLEVLGTTSDRIGPFALLGLTPERCEPHHVRTAVDSLMARIGAHPRNAEPAAEVLRREVKAAAALLLDPTARDELIAAYHQARSSTAASGRPSPAPATTPPASSNGHRRSVASAPNYPPAFLRDLLAAWVSAGGWNGKARHRIIAAGAQHGVSGEALLDAILTMPATLAAPRETPLVGPPPASLPQGGMTVTLPASLSPEWQREAHEAAKRNFFAATLAFVGCAAVVVPFAAWVIFQINAMGPKSGPNLAGPEAAPLAPLKTESAPSLPTVRPNDVSLPISPMSQTFAGLLERLDRDSALAGSLDQSTLELFASATSQGRKQWMAFDAAARERLRAVLVSAVYRLGRDARSAEALIDLIDPAELRRLSVEGIPGRAWSVGMLAVMMREPDLPSAARRVVEEHWRRHVPIGAPPSSGDFDAAAQFALQEMIEPLVQDMVTDTSADELWIGWLQCVTAVTTEEQAEALALESARHVLVDGPDIASNETAGRVLAALFSAVRWKKSAAARGALLSWWDNPRVSASDLAVVSSWLVSTRAIVGLDPSFIVPIDADAETRTELRHRLSEAWTAPGGTGSSGSSRTDIAEWIAAADRLLAAPAAATPEDLLAQTITVAFQNTAASMLWAGRPEDASYLLSESEARLVAARLQSGAGAPQVNQARGTDGQWGVRYFRAVKDNDREGLRRLIESLPQESPGELGPIDAAVLADVAHNGQPREVRTMALDCIVQNYAGGPTVLLALADTMIPDRAEQGLSEAIETLTGENLPDVRQEDWYPRARLALLRFVANLRGATSVNSTVDSMAGLLADVYANRVSRQPSAVVVSPSEAGRMHFDQWIEVGRPMQPLAPLPAPLHQLVHRAEIRAAVLDDPIGRFHAWQIGAMEAACYVTAAERPGARQALADLLDTTTLRLAVARNVMEQLLVAERALLRIWAIRLGQVEEGGHL